MAKVNKSLVFGKGELRINGFEVLALIKSRKNTDELLMTTFFSLQGIWTILWLVTNEERIVIKSNHLKTHHRDNFECE